MIALLGARGGRRCDGSLSLSVCLSVCLSVSLLLCCFFLSSPSGVVSKTHGEMECGWRERERDGSRGGVGRGARIDEAGALSLAAHCRLRLMGARARFARLDAAISFPASPWLWIEVASYY